MRLGAPWNWYKLDAKFSIELLQTFARRTETQIQGGIEHFTKNKQRELYVISEEEGIAQNVEHYDRLESMTWDLDTLFKSHFPNLQRKASFITLYSFLENELKKLSKKLQREIGIEKSQEDIKGNGIFRSMTYLEHSIGLNISKDAIPWTKVFEINKLRNIIAHTEGELSNEAKERQEQDQLVEKLKPHVSTDDDGITISETFLDYVLECFDNFFQYLDTAIQKKFSTKESRKGPLKKITLDEKSSDADATDSTQARS